MNYQQAKAWVESFDFYDSDDKYKAELWLQRIEESFRWNFPHSVYGYYSMLHDLRYQIDEDYREMVDAEEDEDYE